jgi:hypothetical protein
LIAELFPVSLELPPGAGELPPQWLSKNKVPRQTLKRVGIDERMGSPERQRIGCRFLKTLYLLSWRCHVHWNIRDCGTISSPTAIKQFSHTATFGLSEIIRDHSGPIYAWQHQTGRRAPNRLSPCPAPPKTAPVNWRGTVFGGACAMHAARMHAARMHAARSVLHIVDLSQQTSCLSL